MRNMKIKNLILYAIIIICVLVLVISGIGITGTNAQEKAMKEMFERNTSAIEDISQIGQLSKVVQSNSASAEEAAAASEELSTQANALKAMVSEFQTTGKIKVNSDKEASGMLVEEAPPKITLCDCEYGKY